MVNHARSVRGLERELCDLWASVLGRPVGPHEDFFDLGGNSLKAIDIVIAARERGITVRSSAIFRNSTPASLAESLTEAGPAPAVPAALLASPQGLLPADALIPIAEGGQDAPLFLVLSDCFPDVERDAPRGWDIGRPIYALSVRGEPGTIPELAERLLRQVRRVQPAGEYHLAGVGSGAVIAFEMARLLRAEERIVARLVMIAPTPPGQPAGDGSDLNAALHRQSVQVTRRFALGADDSAAEILRRFRQDGWYDDSLDAADLPRLQQVSAGIALAVSRYRPGPYDGPVVLLQDEPDPEQTWEGVAEACTVYLFDYGLRWHGRLLMDPRAVELLRKELLP